MRFVIAIGLGMIAIGSHWRAQQFDLYAAACRRVASVAGVDTVGPVAVQCDKCASENRLLAVVACCGFVAASVWTVREKGATT